MSRLTDILEQRRRARARRQVRAEGRHLVTQARRILKRRAYRIPDAARAEVEAAMQRYEAAAARDNNHEEVRESLAAFDDAVERHLSFARKSTVREYSESIGVAVAVALLLRAFVVEAFQIPSGSMIPTLEIGDHIFVSKFAYGISVPFTSKKILGTHAPQRGDVIVFKFPKDTNIDFIKRVIGVPGDRIEIRKNQIIVNGQPLPREHLAGCRDEESSGSPFERRCDLWVETTGKAVHKTMFESSYPTDWPRGTPDAAADGTYVVPTDRVFVMGDNRDNSNDSRVWGTVPLDYIKGKALIVWWSRGPIHGETSFPGVLGGWWDAIRWRRFFSLVE